MSNSTPNTVSVPATAVGKGILGNTDDNRIGRSPQTSPVGFGGSSTSVLGNTPDKLRNDRPGGDSVGAPIKGFNDGGLKPALI